MKRDDKAVCLRTQVCMSLYTCVTCADYAHIFNVVDYAAKAFCDFVWLLNQHVAVAGTRTCVVVNCGRAAHEHDHGLGGANDGPTASTAIFTVQFDKINDMFIYLGISNKAEALQT
jgi:hypothetical protein